VGDHGRPAADGVSLVHNTRPGEGTGATASGTFVAPTPGIHGWFWENPGTSLITITLKTAGFYTTSTEYRDGERIERTFGGK
jgi:hypothetical protein